MNKFFLGAWAFILAGTGCAANSMPRAVLSTSLGDITVELDQAKAPISVKNFQDYCAAGFYNGTTFHRVIKDFMVQGGGFTADMVQKETRAPIKNEAQNGLHNTRGTIAMARTMVVDSATAQFYINVVDNNFLDFVADNPRQYGYAVFGKVISGMEIVDKIRVVPTTVKSGMPDVPVEPVIIKSCQLK